MHYPQKTLNEENFDWFLNDLSEDIKRIRSSRRKNYLAMYGFALALGKYVGLNRYDFISLRWNIYKSKSKTLIVAKGEYLIKVDLAYKNHLADFIELVYSVIRPVDKDNLVFNTFNKDLLFELLEGYGFDGISDYYHVENMLYKQKYFNINFNIDMNGELRNNPFYYLSDWAITIVRKVK